MNFLKSESGAVTVDWVVLTAALVGIGLAVTVVISSGVKDVTTDVDEFLHRDDIIRTSFPVTEETCAQGQAGCTYFFPPEPEVDCSDAIAQGIQDCGVNWTPWIAGSYTDLAGTSYSVNSDNVIIDPWTGDPEPLSMTVCPEGAPACVGGTYDVAGRAVDMNGVPLS